MMWEMLLAATLPTVAAFVIGALVKWMKNLSWVKKLGIEEYIDRAGQYAIHWAEDFARSEELKGKEKMVEARVEFVKLLDKAGIKLTDTEIDVRLAAIFNKYKDVVEHK